MAEHEDRSRSPCRDVSPTQRQRSPGSVSPTQVVLDEEMAGIDEVVLRYAQPLLRRLRGPKEDWSNCSNSGLNFTGKSVYRSCN